MLFMVKIPASLLEQLAERVITKKAAADALGISHSYLCRITPNLPPGPHRERRRAATSLMQSRRTHRLRLAKAVEDGKRSLASAAKHANCSERTMYRYVCKLKK